VETHNFEIRKQLLEYDNVMNRQREVIYGMPYKQWQKEYQKEASPGQLKAFEDTKPLHAFISGHNKAK